MNNNKVWKSLKNTITKMVPAVFTAMIATALGFIALYTSPVPMIQDFGKMLTIGLVISFILGIFLLIPILFIRDHFFSNGKEIKSKTQKEKVSKMDRALDWIPEKTIQFWWLIITYTFVATVYV